jgi:hypothetical protein
MEHSLFIYVTGAGVSRTVAPLLDGLVAQGWKVYTVGTPNLEMVVPVAELLDRPGCHWIRGYKLHPLDIFPFGSMLVVPCTFNTFNKLGNGIGDTLVTAMVADAIGAGLPTYIAPSMNPALWRHPQTGESRRRLESWGCRIIEPQISPERVIMAPIETILQHMADHQRSLG